jgi:E3 ubiquitin-protein ligase ZSWIM2
MSTRSQPYRHKMTVPIATMIGVASRVTLYLLGQNGPTSFVFKDRLDNKYKVSIGSRIQCSCQPNKNDHCLHSIYVMIRIFNIPTDNPLIRQASYLDSELSDIVSGKYSQSRRRMPLLESLLFQSSSDTPAEDFQDTNLQRP